MKNISSNGEIVSRKYFLYVMCKVLVLFIILSIVIAFVLFYFYKMYTMDELKNFYRERVKIITNQIDSRYTKIKQLAIQLSYNDRILRWIYSSNIYLRDYYLLKEINAISNAIVTAHGELFSVDIYNGRENSVLSTYSGYWQCKNFHKYTFSKDFIFKEFMNNPSRLQILNNFNGLYNINIPYITLLCSLPLNTKIGAVAFVIQIGKLFDERIHSYENIIVLDNNNNIYYQLIGDKNVEMDISDNFSNYLKKYTEYDHIYIRKINSSNYYMSTTKIFDNNFKIIILIPESVLMAQRSTTDYILQFKVVITFLVILSLILSYFVYRISKKPINLLAGNLKKKISEELRLFEDFSHKDEVHYLDEVLYTIIHKSNELQKHIEENKEFLIENILRNIIFGREFEGIYNFEELNFLLHKPSNFIVLIFNIDKVKTPGFQDKKQFAVSYLKNQILSVYRGYYLKTGPQNDTILLNLNSSHSKIELMRLIRELQATIQKDYGVTVSVGISDLKDRIEFIPQAYDEALNALKHKIVLGNNQIIDYVSINRLRGNNYYFSLKDGEKFIKVLRVGNEKEISQTLDEIIQNKLQKYPIELLNAFFFYIASCIAQVAVEYNIKPENIFEPSIFEMLVNYERIEEKLDYLKLQCKKIVEARKAEQKRYKNLSVDIIIKYIEQNYDKPIGLKQLASDLAISTSYLSSLLKKKLGVSFNTYVTNLRMEKAKELLLKGSKYTIKDIAYKVGYDSEQAFIRNFKRVFGRTPSEYRTIVNSQIKTENILRLI